ncbi:MAG: hypothetical protein GX422_04745 [Deltaproteobacteria bacterium]|nr:hypothetical protein [Deltaproteobacteria bacterium]
MKSMFQSHLQILLTFTIIIFSFLVSVSSSLAQGEEKEDRPTVNASMEILSQYVFRGVALSADSAVIQPSIALGCRASL